MKTVLIVDDNEDDVFALRRALKKADVASAVHVLTNGQQVLDCLSGEGLYADRSQFPLPDLLFLDLKMPFLDGFEVLAWIRTQPGLNQLAVVVLTGSDEEKDHQRATSLGARAYLVKPPTATDVTQLLSSLQTQEQPPGM